eukprot:5829085-Lingulodinium_polyedra.AAC.1
MTSTEELVSFAKTWKSVSRVLAKHDLDELESFAEVVKLQLKEDALGMVQKAGKRPVLMAYQSDGTCPRVRVRRTSKAQPGEPLLIRSGFEKLDMLMQVGSVTTVDYEGNATKAWILSDPVPMRLGER